MKIVSKVPPESSFLSTEKDMEIITSTIMKNQNLKKLLHYTTTDCLIQPNLTEDETLELFGKNIKIVPKLKIDSSVRNYLFIKMDNFTANTNNPQFRDNYIEFDIICHYEQWQLKDFQLRPYKIAAELDTMFSNRHLTGIGKLEFTGAQIIHMTDEFGGICLMYKAIHGGEDKYKLPNPDDEEQFLENFDGIFNE